MTEQLLNISNNQFGGGGGNNPSSTLPLEYLHPSDEILIQSDMQDIIADATQYINNLHSENMKNYNKYHNLIYSKYAGKKYKIETPLNQIIVFTNDKKKTLIHIHKPEYIQISRKLKQYRDLISKSRIEIDNQFYNITHTTGGILATDKDNFLKMKKEFLNLLKKYYTILAYRYLKKQTHNSNYEGVNSSVEASNKKEYDSENDKTSINSGLIDKSDSSDSSVEIYVNTPTKNLKEVSGTMIWTPIIKGSLMKVSKSQVLLQQQYQSDKLNQYNEILTLLHSGNKDSEPVLKEKILEYINNKDTISFTSPIDVYEDLIITDLPKIIVQ